MKRFLSLLLLSSWPCLTVAQNAQVGQTGAVITVEQLQDDVPGNEFMRPATGNKFVAVKILFDNREGREPISSNQLFFHVKDSEGNVYDASLLNAVEPSIPPSDVDPEDFVRGWITFEVKRDVSVDRLRLRYESWTERSDWINLGVTYSTSPSSSTETSDSCTNAMTIREILECATQRYAIADDELNATYQEVMDALTRSADLEYVTVVKQQLIEAQRAWIAFRDENCEAIADHLSGAGEFRGMEHPITQTECVTRMAEERTKELRSLFVEETVAEPKPSTAPELIVEEAEPEPPPFDGLTNDHFMQLRREMRDDMTDLQFRQVQERLVGQPVRWQGWVEEVREDAEIWVDMDSPRNLLSVPDITLEDVPASVGIQLRKNQSITFEGWISGIDKMLSALMIDVRNVRLVEY